MPRVRKNIDENGNPTVQRVNIYMPVVDYTEFHKFFTSHGMTQSDAACYLIKQGESLRRSVRSDILRELGPALTAFSDISSDLLVLWCQHGTELTPIIGSDTYCRFRDRIADAISDLTAAILAA